MKVLIVGAGPTGLTAALEFVKNGIIPEIVDKKLEASEMSRAVGILPESIEKLSFAGVGDSILKEGVLFEKIKIHRGEKTLANLNLLKSLTDKEVPVSLPQDRTESIMAEALEKLGVSVQYGLSVTDIKTSDKEASVTFSNNTTKSYDWVIGADGVGSIVRQKMGIKYVGYDLPETWSIADVDLEKNEDMVGFSAWIQVEGTGGAVIMIPIEADRVRIVSSTPDCLKTLPIKLNIKKIRRTGVFNISIRQAETYLKGRVLLAGDSAHAHSPVGGRGMNLGIDDAVDCVESILNKKTVEYSERRHTIGADILKTSEVARRIIVSNNFLVKTLTYIVLKLIHNFSFLQKRFSQKLTRL